VSDAAQDALECPPVEFFVVDDEYVRCVQGLLRGAEGGREQHRPAPPPHQPDVAQRLKGSATGADALGMERGMSRGARRGAAGVVRDAVAVVDAEPLVQRAICRILAPCGHTIVAANDLDALGSWLSSPRLAVLLLDLCSDRPGGADQLGLERIERVRRERPDVEVIAMTARPSIESAVSCMRAGAFDFLCKPFIDVDRVLDSVEAASLRASGGDAGELRPARGRAGAHDLSSDWVRVPLVAEPATDVPLSLEAYERLALERALREAGGDAAEAAKRLGIGRSTYYRRAARVGVDLRTGEGGLGA